MWLREHGRVYSAGSPVDTGEIALYKNYSLLLLLLLRKQKLNKYTDMEVNIFNTMYDGSKSSKH